MSLLATIRADQITARKAQNRSEVQILSFLIDAATKVGKTAGNRESTEEEVLRAVRANLKKVQETKDAIFSSSVEHEEKVVARLAECEAEITILNRYLPKQMTEDEIRAVVVKFLEANPGSHIGPIMKHLQQNHLGQYDGKTANLVVKAALA